MHGMKHTKFTKICPERAALIHADTPIERWMYRQTDVRKLIGPFRYLFGRALKGTHIEHLDYLHGFLSATQKITSESVSKRKVS